MSETARRPSRRAARCQSARAIAAATGALAAHGQPALAQPKPGGGMPIIRDAEIEQLLREYTAPILRAAGLRSRISRSS